MGLFSFSSRHFSFSTRLLALISDSTKVEQVEGREEGLGG